MSTVQGQVLAWRARLCVQKKSTSPRWPLYDHTTARMTDSAVQEALAATVARLKKDRREHTVSELVAACCTPRGDVNLRAWQARLRTVREVKVTDPQFADMSDQEATFRYVGPLRLRTDNAAGILEVLQERYPRPTKATDVRDCFPAAGAALQSLLDAGRAVILTASVADAQHTGTGLHADARHRESYEHLFRLFQNAPTTSFPPTTIAHHMHAKGVPWKECRPFLDALVTQHLITKLVSTHNGRSANVWCLAPRQGELVFLRPTDALSPAPESVKAVWHATASSSAAPRTAIRRIEDMRADLLRRGHVVLDSPLHATPVATPKTPRDAKTKPRLPRPRTRVPKSIAADVDAINASVNNILRARTPTAAPVDLRAMLL